MKIKSDETIFEVSFTCSAAHSCMRNIRQKTIQFRKEQQHTDSTTMETTKIVLSLDI